MIALDMVGEAEVAGASAVTAEPTDAAAESAAENCLISISQSSSSEREEDGMEVMTRRRTSRRREVEGIFVECERTVLRLKDHPSAVGIGQSERQVVVKLEQGI